MWIYKIFITLFLMIILVSCEKSNEKLFDHSLIPGQDYWGNSEEYKFLGMSADYYNYWGEIHEHDPCSLTRVREIPPYVIDEYNSYYAEIINLGEKRYLIKIDIDDPFLPKEIEIELNGKYHEDGGNYYAYFDIVETELYEASNCGAANVMFSGNYFKVFQYIPNTINYRFELKSKTGDSLVWSYAGKKN